VQGREPHGVIAPADYEKTRDELIAKLAAIAAPSGGPAGPVRNIGTVAYKPEDIYQHTRGVPPDLIVYFGNLYWRSVGSVGHGRYYTFENDIGPDDANHAQYGVFIMRDGQRQGLVEGLHITDIGPTVLDLLGLPVPTDMEGKVIQ
jgi:predicted AlkP superfamily phosphohydrolase/phosphomutase